MREFIYTCPRELRKIVLMVLPAVSMPAYKQSVTYATETDGGY